jgi:hypothetical protein
MFKDVYKWMLGPKAAQYQTIGFLCSSACAEVIADTFLAPFEAVSFILFRHHFFIFPPNKKISYPNSIQIG